MTTYFRIIFFSVLGLCVLQSEGLGLTNEPVFSQFQLNLITPGARATGLGGSFIGLADDATAVETNPAGLTILTNPEVSMEFKHIVYTANQIYANPFSENFASIIEIGVAQKEITRANFSDGVESLPFVSLVYPYKRFVFALYRQESVNYESSYRTSPYEIMVPGTLTDLRPEEASADICLINYGVSMAFQPFKNFSLAISPKRSEVKMKSHCTDFFSDVGFEAAFNESLEDDDLIFTPTDFSDADILHETRIDDEDVSYSVNAGIQWRPHPKISFGAVYRSGPKFSVTQTLMLTEKYMTLFGHGYEAFAADVDRFTLKVPDSFGVGIAFRVTEFLTLILDVVHIQYEELLQDFDIINNPETYSENNFTIDNATEIHVGLEYVFTLGQRYLALRTGVYNEPDHTIRFTGSTGNPDTDFTGRALFPGSDDQLHFTSGLGIVFNEHFQVDTAVNIAEKNKQLSLSAVYRF